MQTPDLKEVVLITGTKASGKGAVAEPLKEEGFAQVIYSDCIKADMRAHGLGDAEVNDTLRQIEFSNARKQEERDGGLWTYHALRRSVDLRIALLYLDGVRNPGEIDAIRRILDPQGIPWTLIVTDAPIELRERLFLARNRPGDPTTSEGFRDLDARDRGRGQNAFGQQVDACMALVPRDLWLINDGTLEQWHAKCRERVRNRHLYSGLKG